MSDRTLTYVAGMIVTAALASVTYLLTAAGMLALGVWK